MLNSKNAMLILGVCAIVLMITMGKKILSWGIGVFLRAATGAAGIYLLNLLCSMGGISLSVGINLFNLLIVGTLGFPGFGLLYAVTALSFF